MDADSRTFPVERIARELKHDWTFQKSGVHVRVREASKRPEGATVDGG